jgi:hypothetical protein
MDMEKTILLHLKVLFQFSIVTIEDSHEKARLLQGLVTILSGVTTDLI